MSLNDSSATDSRTHLLRQLRRQLEGRATRGKSLQPAPASTPCLSTVSHRFSCGIPAVDRLLPGGGLVRGTLVEWVGGGRASSFTLSLLAAREACREGGLLVVVDPARTFYPPTSAKWGIDLGRLIVVHPQNARDALWAAVQALRSPAVAAMWLDDSLGLRLPQGRNGYREAPLGKTGHDERAFRRMQLAAQAGRTLGLVARAASAKGQPSWADVRLEVSPSSAVAGPLPSCRGPSATDHGNFVQVHLLRCRHGRAGGAVTIEIDDTACTVREARSHHEAHPLPVVSKLADPTLACGTG